jgi:hypothetical protein
VTNSLVVEGQWPNWIPLVAVDRELDVIIISDTPVTETLLKSMSPNLRIRSTTGGKGTDYHRDCSMLSLRDPGIRGPAIFYM